MRNFDILAPGQFIYYYNDYREASYSRSKFHWLVYSVGNIKQAPDGLYYFKVFIKDYDKLSEDIKKY